MNIGLTMAEIEGDNDNDADENHKSSQSHEIKGAIMNLCEIDMNLLKGYVYRGEGNANIVIALPITRSVLRFRKIKSINDVSIDGGRARVVFEQKFFKHYISKYLGIFVNLPKVYRCHPRDIPNWNELVELNRPNHRRHASLYDEYATELPDYSLLPAIQESEYDEKSTYCIEIKPKQGFVPEADRYIQKCPYCINQFYKIKEKKISQRSRYCPCDLFSGDINRVRRAIDALVESPQNNFIVFKNSFHAWGEGCERKDLACVLMEWFSATSVCNIKYLFEDLSYLVSEALLREFDTNQDDLPLTVDPIKVSEITTMQPNSYHVDYDTIQRVNRNLCLLNESCKYPSGNLPHGSVLDRIYRMQTSHRTSADVIQSIYSSYSKELNEEKVYFSSQEELELVADSNNKAMAFISDKITLLRNYLLFSIAKDCSILLAFREINFDRIQNIPAKNVILLPRQSRYFIFNVSITDVDSKKLNCIEKHRQQTICALNSIIM